MLPPWHEDCSRNAWETFLSVACFYKKAKVQLWSG